MAIPDVQSGSDERNLAIDQVGIRGLRYPLAFADGDAPAQSTIGTFAVMVALPEDRKGTHMSRLIEMLEELTAPGAAPLSVPGMRALLDQLVVRLDAPAGRIEVAFPWFVRKTAPISGVASLLDYEVRLAAELPGRPVCVARDGRRPGDVALPLLQGDLGVRRAQPALDDHDQRAPARAGPARRAAARRRDGGVERALRHPQAGRREVPDRTRVRQPPLRRGPGPRRRRAPGRRPALRRLRGRGRELRVDPQPLGLRAHRPRPGAASLGSSPPGTQDLAARPPPVAAGRRPSRPERIPSGRDATRPRRTPRIRPSPSQCPRRWRSTSGTATTRSPTACCRRCRRSSARTCARSTAGSTRPAAGAGSSSSSA